MKVQISEARFLDSNCSTVYNRENKKYLHLLMQSLHYLCGLCDGNILAALRECQRQYLDGDFLTDVYLKECIVT
jgi:hypothetical protein